MEQLKRIGTGLFSKVYLKSDNKTVLIKSTCPIKECMSMHWFPSSELFPKLNRVDIETYEMPYYPHVSSLKQNLRPDQYLIYKQLRDIFKRIPFIPNPYDSLDRWRDQFEHLENKELSHIMIEAIEACSNYGSDIKFEISPRNVAVTSDGKLILIDVFYSHSALIRARKGTK